MCSEATIQQHLPPDALAAPPHSGPRPPRKGTMKGSSLSGGSRLTAAGGGEPGPLVGLPGDGGVPPPTVVGLPPAGLHPVDIKLNSTDVAFDPALGVPRWSNLPTCCQCPCATEPGQGSASGGCTCCWGCPRQRWACRASRGRAHAPATPARPTDWALGIRPPPPCVLSAARTACCTAPAAMRRHVALKCLPHRRQR